MRCNPFCFPPFPSAALVVISLATVVPPKETDNGSQRYDDLSVFPLSSVSCWFFQQRIGVQTLDFCHPELTYAWIFNEYPHFVQQDSRRFISQETGSLYIAKVERSDVGNYTCVVNNTVTGDKVLSSPTPLVLRSDGKCMLFPHALFKQQGHMVDLPFYLFFSFLGVAERRWKTLFSTPTFLNQPYCKPWNLIKTHFGLQ